ncbi:MAG: hypothetical protein KAR16_05265 [Bacteroidales bacterium]|nr:hypothetical protein [Bacteroidales bacterium]
MKKMRGLRILTALLVLLMTGFMLQAQNVSSQEAEKKAQQEKEMQMREKEIQMKKQMLEQERKTAELEREFARQSSETARARDRAVIYARTPSDEGSYFIQSYGQKNQSQLTLRNSFRGTSDASKGEFDVDENTSHLRFTINGKVRSGKITIKILYPGGKVFKDLTINSSAEITFSQSMTIKEEEKKKYVGAWKYEVKAEEAEGSYMLSIMTQ